MFFNVLHFSEDSPHVFHTFYHQNIDSIHEFFLQSSWPSLKFAFSFSPSFNLKSLVSACNHLLI